MVDRVALWRDGFHLAPGMVVAFHVGGSIELRSINQWGEPVSGGRFLACNDR